MPWWRQRPRSWLEDTRSPTRSRSCLCWPPALENATPCDELARLWNVELGPAAAAGDVVADATTDADAAAAALSFTSLQAITIALALPVRCAVCVVGYGVRCFLTS